jgi:hypothetical protein
MDFKTAQNIGFVFCIHSSCILFINLKDIKAQMAQVLELLAANIASMKWNMACLESIQLDSAMPPF